jgi:hypothetical protein
LPGAAQAAARGSTSIAIEALGAAWLFANGEATWQAPAGQRVARVGPLPVLDATQYTAR